MFSEKKLVILVVVVAVLVFGYVGLNQYRSNKAEQARLEPLSTRGLPPPAADVATELFKVKPILELKIQDSDTSSTSTTSSQQWKLTGITNKQIKRVTLESHDGSTQSTIHLEFNTEGTKLIYETTKANIGKKMGIFVNGKLLSAPRIGGVINEGQVIISGNLSVDEANSIASQINNTIPIANRPILKLVPVDDVTKRDNIRIEDVQQINKAIKLYYNDKNPYYPKNLKDLVPNYISKLPVAPTPADGDCSFYDNSYEYTLVSSESYVISFCLGNETSGYSAGYHTMNPNGIISSDGARYLPGFSY